MFIALLRRGWLEGKIIIQTVLPVVDMIVMPGDNFICAATTDKMLHCYTKRVCRNMNYFLFNQE